MTATNRRTPAPSLLLLLVCLAAPAWADKKCLTGSDPAVAADAGQIATLEGQIAVACPCASFDGTKGKKRGDYASCAVAVIKAAVKQGNLRTQCKGRMVQAHRFSTCGMPASEGALPCLWVKPGGKIKCVISTAAKCQSDSRYTRTSCPGYHRCVDAGDTNGDHLVGAGDSGTCIAPPAPTATITVAAIATATHTPTASTTGTPTVTATPTPPATATGTTTATSTDTPSQTASPTQTPDETWTRCADEGEICTTPLYRMVRYGVPGSFNVILATSTSIECSNVVFGDPAFNHAKYCEYSSREYPTPTAPTVTATGTITSTPTPTAAPDWVYCAPKGETCTLPAHDQLVAFRPHRTPAATVADPPGTEYITTIADTSVECSPAVLFPDQPAIHALDGDCYSLSWTCDFDTPAAGDLVIDRFGDFPQVRPLYPFIPHFTCATSSLCNFDEPLSAEEEHEFDARAIDPRVCDPADRAKLSFRWRIHYPPSAGNGESLFIPQGITGYRGPVLRFATQTMPTLAGIGDERWRLYLEITREPDPDRPTTSPATTTYWFRFLYTEATATIAMATDCQGPSPTNCEVPNFLRAPEGTY